MRALTPVIANVLMAGALAVAAFGGPALAQSAGNFELELNTATDVPEGCRLTYVATNGTGAALDQTSFEVAVWNDKGDVVSIVILDFGALPENKTRVVQFDLPQMGCPTISRLLINNQRDCTSGGATTDICITSLNASSRVQTIQFGL